MNYNAIWCINKPVSLALIYVNIDLYYIIFVFLRFYITSFYYFVKIANEGKKHEKLNSIDSVIISFQIKQDCNVNDKKTL